MSEEDLANALNELQEAVKEMIRNRKRLVRETNRGVSLSDYKTFQDIFLLLEDSKYVVKAKLMDWEDLLPEDGDGDPVYPDLGQDGFDFTRVKSIGLLDATTKVLESAEIALARFVVSLNPTQHAKFRDEAKIKMLGNRNYAEMILAPHVDVDSDSSTLVPETVQQEVPIFPQPYTTCQVQR